jgi:predicted Zn-dependent peptidase
MSALDIVTRQLPSGLRVAAAHLPSAQSVSVGFWSSVGSRHEPAPMSGAAHFIEHMLFKGTKRRSSRQISEAIEGVGGYLNAFTSEDHTCYYARAPREYFNRLGSVLSDMVLDSVFESEEVEREREVIRDEILMYRDQPSQHVHELLSAALWPGHPLGRPVTGTLDTVGGMKRRDLISFYRENYPPSSMLLTVAGPVQAGEVFQLAHSLESRWKTRTTTPRARRWRGNRVPSRVFKAQETEQSHAAVGYRMFGRTDPRRYAFRLASVILGENMSSRLFQELRERRGLCYSVHTGTLLFAETGVFTIELGLDPANLPKAFALIRKQLDRFLEKGPSAGELRRAKDYVAGQIRMGLETPGGVMNWVGESIVSFGSVLDAEGVIRQIRAATVEDVMEASRAVLAELPPAVAVIGPAQARPGGDPWLEDARRVR